MQHCSKSKHKKLTETNEAPRKKAERNSLNLTRCTVNFKVDKIDRQKKKRSTSEVRKFSISDVPNGRFGCCVLQILQVQWLGILKATKQSVKKVVPWSFLAQRFFFVSYAVTKLVPHLPNKGHIQQGVVLCLSFISSHLLHTLLELSFPQTEVGKGICLIGLLHSLHTTFRGLM